MAASREVFSRSSTPPASDAAYSRTVKPRLSIVRDKSSRATKPGRYSTVAFSVARLTEARTTPLKADRLRSMRETQDAQWIPPTDNVTDLISVGSVVDKPCL